jgi:hypothetical protein
MIIHKSHQKELKLSKEMSQKLEEMIRAGVIQERSINNVTESN